MGSKQNWKRQPDGHDYPAAADYLSLVAPPEAVEATVAALRTAPLVNRKAKDRVCASYHVSEDADIPLRMVDLAGG